LDNRTLNMAFRFAVLALVLGYVSATKFDCITMGPIGRQIEDAETKVPFVIFVDTSKEYRPGDVVKVTVKSETKTFDSFIIQGRRPMSEEPLGVFRVDPSDSISSAIACANPGDTLVNKANPGINTVTATWLVPGNTDANEVEFDIGIAASDGKFWIFNTQMIAISARDLHKVESPRHPTAAEERERSRRPEHSDEEETDVTEDQTEEDEGPKEDPNEAERRAAAERAESLRRDHMDKEILHDAKDEQEMAIRALEKRRQEIQEEDRMSEGEWQKDEERERREHEKEVHDEEIEYERLVAEEEKERQERIRAEILDKEEHDRLPKKTLPDERPSEEIDGEDEFGKEIDPRKIEEPEVKDGQNAAGRVYYSAVAMVLVFLALFW